MGLSPSSLLEATGLGCRSSRCGAMGWRVLGALGRRSDPPPSMSQWVEHLALPQLRLRLQLQLGSVSWPGNSVCGEAKKKKKKDRAGEKKETQRIQEEIKLETRARV